MRRIIEIPVGQIRMDRYPLNPTMIPLLDHMRSGGTVPPIHVVRLRGGGFQIRDGRHRITASKLLGRTTIKARASDKPLQHG